LPKLTDLPPVWLALSLGLVWALDRLVPWGIFGPRAQAFGAALIGLGLALMAVAAAQMLARRTTVIPKNDPAALVTGGVFRLSRNPIYLGDALVLAGAILWWDVPHGVPVLIGFMALIQHRFILDEEARLKRHFGPQFDAWSRRTGRWITGPF
jgi:protein-S-isoprenylcysteine O-methyltransferase Ste14